MKPSIVFSIILIVALLGLTGIYFSDVVPPEAALTPAEGPVSKERLPELTLFDKSRGIKELVVTVVQGDKTIPLLRRTYSKSTHEVVEPLPLDKAGLADGPFQLMVKATDHAIYHFGAGNTLEKEYRFIFDSTPPVISVFSRAHNLNRGGTGLIIYGLSEDVVRSGISVGDRFFPGFELSEGKHVCVFAHPYDVPTKDFSPQLVAEDTAGNLGTTGFYYHTNPRSLPRSKITINDRFLKTKMPQFASLYPETSDFLEIFLKVNGALREKNRARLKNLSTQTENRFLWDGEFLRLANAAPMGRFGDRRSYYAKGKKIDEQVHLGIDLASVAQASVQAANTGKVVLAEWLGIYGNCVIIDHGLGLQTLYGHLSRIDVKTGDRVDKGQFIGRTGATGLAGGDHLHYAVLAGGLPVNPIEWWDPTWISHNIQGKIDELIP